MKNWDTEYREHIEKLEQQIKELKDCNNDLIGNHDGSLDEFLLNSIEYTQEERELVMEVVSKWIELANGILNKH